MLVFDKPYPVLAVQTATTGLTDFGMLQPAPITIDSAPSDITGQAVCTAFSWGTSL